FSFSITATTPTALYTLSLHDALPICCASAERYLEVEVDGQGPSIHRLSYVKTNCAGTFEVANNSLARAVMRLRRPGHPAQDLVTDRKSTRLNSSHQIISYAVFCLKKK